MAFPETRMRRLRRTASLRAMVREHRLHPADFVLPIFVQHGSGERTPIDSLPGHARLSIDLAVELAQEADAAGIGGVILFGIPAVKDEHASEAADDEGIVQMAVRAIKARCERLTVMTDVCLCQYTSHGHCGVVHEGEILNDVSLELLAAVAVSHARAGADVVAPSDMMDGRVGAIRSQLDAEHCEHVSILSYSAKYASAYYGPFREAAGSTPQFGDRRAYQMDPANVEEAVREAFLDLEEGADMLMVKPALSYLDVVRRIKDETGMPMAVYNVSGEYSIVKAAAERGWVDERAMLLEQLVSMKRAGADIIISYASLDAARWIRDEGSV
jgi:porphobilinogen synthase